MAHMWQVVAGVRISKLTALAGLWALASSWGRLGVREHTSRAALRGARSKILRQAWRERSYMRSWRELFLVVRGVRRKMVGKRVPPCVRGRGAPVLLWLVISSGLRGAKIVGVAQ